jgi:hypothetical protein
LKNRHVRVVIDEKTGDAIHWGLADGSCDVLDGWPLQSWLSICGVVAPDGYIEKRDDQTWQYLGEDKANGIGWRRTYCLEGDRLYVTFLIQNNRAYSIDTIGGLTPKAILGTWPSEGHWRPDTYEGATPLAHVHLQAYNEKHPHDWPTLSGSATRPTTLPILLSDLHHLKPGDRISWTMQWTLEENAKR